MTFDQFNKFQEKLFNEVKAIQDTKGKEYAHSADRFANFNRLAAGLDLPNITIAWIYCKKHLDSIESFIKDGQVYSTESIYGRFVDAITYLTLIAGMVEEKEAFIKNYQEHTSKTVMISHCSSTNVIEDLGPGSFFIDEL